MSRRARRGAALLCLASVAVQPLAAQQLRLKSISPVEGWHLSPQLGVPEDSLRLVGRGVWIHDVQVGNGVVVDSGMVVQVHFVGMLANGTIFSATERKPLRFTLGANQVIAGWEDGIVGMRVGGRRQLVVPPDLGYGLEGDGPVPPDAVLIFDVTLVDVSPES